MPYAFSLIQRALLRGVRPTPDPTSQFAADRLRRLATSSTSSPGGTQFLILAKRQLPVYKINNPVPVNYSLLPLGALNSQPPVDLNKASYNIYDDYSLTLDGNCQNIATNDLSMLRFFASTKPPVDISTPAEDTPGKEGPKAKGPPLGLLQKIQAFYSGPELAKAATKNGNIVNGGTRDWNNNLVASSDKENSFNSKSEASDCYQTPCSSPDWMSSKCRGAKMENSKVVQNGVGKNGYRVNGVPHANGVPGIEHNPKKGSIRLEQTLKPTRQLRPSIAKGNERPSFNSSKPEQKKGKNGYHLGTNIENGRQQHAPDSSVQRYELASGVVTSKPPPCPARTKSSKPEPNSRPVPVPAATTEKPGNKRRLPVKTEIKTTQFGTADTDLADVVADVMWELQHRNRKGHVVCAELQFLSPAGQRDTETEARMRAEVTRMVRRGRYACGLLMDGRMDTGAPGEALEVAEEWRKADVNPEPELGKRDVPSYEWGNFRCYHPELISLAHQDSKKEHRSIWRFRRRGPNWKRFGRIFGPGFGRAGVVVNLIMVDF